MVEGRLLTGIASRELAEAEYSFTRPSRIHIRNSIYSIHSTLTLPKMGLRASKVRGKWFGSPIAL